MQFTRKSSSDVQKNLDVQNFADTVIFETVVGEVALRQTLDS